MAPVAHILFSRYDSMVTASDASLRRPTPIDFSTPTRKVRSGLTVIDSSYRTGQLFKRLVMFLLLISCNVDMGMLAPSQNCISLY
jgi:hypothetical protein